MIPDSLKGIIRVPGIWIPDSLRGLSGFRVLLVLVFSLGSLIFLSMISLLSLRNLKVPPCQVQKSSQTFFGARARRVGSGGRFRVAWLPAAERVDVVAFIDTPAVDGTETALRPFVADVHLELQHLIFQCHNLIGC